MASLQKLLLYDLKIGLADLLDDRLKALTSTKAGQSYEAMLAQKRAAIDALPSALVGGRPLATELAETDADHDGFGTAVWHLTEAYLNLPHAPPEIVAAARRIRAAFIPKLDELGDSYASEAAKAQARRDDEKKRKADLKLFPVVGNNKTLDLWVDQFLTAGEKLDELLGQRADTTGTRANAGKLRTATIGLLNRLRGAIDDELEHDPTLPRNLDTQIFAYFDQLAKMRAAGGSPPPAPPGAPPGGGMPPGDGTP